MVVYWFIISKSVEYHSYCKHLILLLTVASSTSAHTAKRWPSFLLSLAVIIWSVLVISPSFNEDLVSSSSHPHLHHRSVLSRRFTREIAILSLLVILLNMCQNPLQMCLWCQRIHMMKRQVICLSVFAFLPFYNRLTAWFRSCINFGVWFSVLPSHSCVWGWTAVRWFCLQPGIAPSYPYFAAWDSIL